MNAVRILSLLLAVVMLSGCDLQNDDSDAVLFNGTWRLSEAGSRETDFTELVLARFDAVVITFIASEKEFAMLLDVGDSPEDELFSGTFRVDSDDREIDLSSSLFPRTFDFEYQFINADKIVLSSDDGETILETLFGINLDVDDVILVFERT